MKIVLQRVSSSKVTIDRRVVGSIGRGILILLGVEAHDTEENADFLAAKCADLRIFQDEDGKMNRSLTDLGAEALVVSQFTLLADCSKGRRPSFINAAPPQKAFALYEYFLTSLRKRVTNVQTGEFGADMSVELVNDGPVTVIIEK